HTHTYTHSRPNHYSSAPLYQEWCNDITYIYPYRGLRSSSITSSLFFSPTHLSETQNISVSFSCQQYSLKIGCFGKLSWARLQYVGIKLKGLQLQPAMFIVGLFCRTS